MLFLARVIQVHVHPTAVTDTASEVNQRQDGPVKVTIKRLPRPQADVLEDDSSASRAALAFGLVQDGEEGGGHEEEEETIEWERALGWKVLEL